MGHVDYDDFKQRMFGDAQTPLPKVITHKGLAQVVGFPPSIQCHELVMECVRHYDSNKRVILGPQGRIMENITEEFIVGTFNIGSHQKLVKIKGKEAK